MILLRVELFLEFDGSWSSEDEEDDEEEEEEEEEEEDDEEEEEEEEEEEGGAEVEGEAEEVDDVADVISDCSVQALTM